VIYNAAGCKTYIKIVKTKLCCKEITGKYATESVIKHAQNSK
jgi:hypothetical protein